MKNIKTLIWLSILLLLIPAIPTQAATNQTAVGVSSAFLERTGVVNLSVFISSDEKIAGGSLDILYDTEKLRINATDANMTNALSSYLTSGGSDGAGTISLSFAKATGSVVDSTVMEIKATVLAGGSGQVNELTLANVELYTEQGKKITAQLIDGQIKPFEGKEETYTKPVTGNKSWVITLSTPYNPATLNAQAVSMKRGSYVVPVEVEVVSAKQFRVKPVETYTRGTYTMDITDQLRSANGKKLSQPVRFTFKVN
ncbi:hypothetical protein DV702_00385 [Sporosarcina sp. PTS2304]|uniref:cohesin domain-containing protein n=1 Tax=Sporosarcina sp. PTS2304 TaxID=2283194 RepID=UPI000E0D43CB|nr:cohesin domain-containing protein [Sporosarcina sp. PTS2304]AXH98294.1 hypothetical protein DV702_00385 [Sporosarcina sp. PTS2304]